MGVETKNYDNLPVIDALASATNNFVGAQAGPGVAAASMDMKPGAIVSSIEDAGEKLDTIGRLRDMAVTALNDGPGQSSAPLNSPQGMRQMVTESLIKLGVAAAVAAVVPAAGAAMAVGAAIGDGMSAGMSGHAALGGAPSSFKVSSSEGASKSKSSMPDEGGWQYGGASAVSPALQAQNPKIAPAQLEAEQQTVNRVIASRDQKGVAQELGAISVAEQKLVMQINSAREVALKDFGVDSPDMLVQRGGPDGDPRLAEAARAPKTALAVAPPQVAGPKALGGIFG